MPAPSIINGSKQFFTNIYEGNGDGQKVGKFVPFTDSGTITNSCVFDKNGPDYYSKTQGSGGTSTKKFTFSCWFKLGSYALAGTSGYFPALFNVGNETGKYFSLFYQSQYKNFQYYSYQSTYDARGITVRTFEDTSKWYHIVIAADTTDSTAGDRVKLYIDGERITSFTNAVNPSLNYDFSVGAAEPYNLGFINSGDTWDGYIAEANYIDGTAYTPSTFGLTDTSTGRWIPKTLSGISYGTLGYRLNFSDASSDAAMGTDSSGNSHTFTLNGNLAATSQTTDSPTQNFNNMGGSKDSGVTVSKGNLTVNSGSSGGYIQSVGLAPFGVATGKWYWEVKVTTVGAAVYGWKDDISTSGSQANDGGSSAVGGLSTGGAGSFSAGSWYVELDYSNEVNYTTVSTNDVLMFAIDLDNGKGYCGKNGTWFNSANPANGTGQIGGCHRANGINKFYPCVNRLDSASVGEFNFGQRSFAYTIPTGFSPWQQDNLPTTDKGISDFVWIKNRDASDSHQLYNSTSGPRQSLTSDDDAAEVTVEDGLQKFLKGGFQTEDDVKLNTNGESYVAWNWLCNSGTTSANTSATPTISSTIQANRSAGFSIVTYTGTGSNGTVEHGLSQAPEWVMIKSRSNDTGDGFAVYHAHMTSAGYYLRLHASNAEAAAATVFNSTAPTSSVVSIGTATGVNTNTYTYLMYCWHSIEGYSKFGRYFGNGSSDGPMVYTGFKPAWVMIKRRDSTSGAYWSIQDNTRVSINPKSKPLLADTTDPESGLSAATMDFYANGFKIRNTLGSNNTSGGTYLYMAFAEHPFIGVDGTSIATAV